MATALQSETQTDPPYVWRSPDRSVSIRLDLDVLDRLGAEVMRGYGRVPKRGAEVGGILLGKLVSSLPLVVEVRDFVPADCEYERGPSFLLSAHDRDALRALVAEHRTAGEWKIVGFYRSDTREGCAITPEDVALFDELFPGPEQVFLLVKPSATHIPQAGFLYRERGKLEASEPSSLFPFRRKELTGDTGKHPAQEEEPRRRTRKEKRPVEVASPPVPVALPPRPAKRPSLLDDNSFIPAPPGPPPQRPSSPAPQPQKPPAWDWESPAEAAFREEMLQESLEPPFGGRSAIWQQAREETIAALDKAEAGRARRSRWLNWVSVAIVCSLIGLGLGREWAWRLAQSSPGQVYYDLHLAAKPQDRNMVITWQADAPAVRHAARGLLTIADGSNNRVTVDLSREELSAGKLIYRNMSPAMQFRLEVSEPSGGSVSQTAGWHE